MSGDPRAFDASKLAWPHFGVHSNTLNPLIAHGEVPKADRLWKVVDPYLKSVLKWDKRQSAFLDALMSGRIDGSLLFPDHADLAAKVSRHPALQWKLQNLTRRR